MKPEACHEVANKSRKQAELYLQKGNAGRAFAHFLVALKLCPSWKIELSQNFTSALRSWGETLDQQQRYNDLFNCYEQALEVLPDNEEVLNNLGTHLYRWGHVTEACNYFRRAVACNPGFLPARSNFQGSCNLLVECWHFRMLNDSIRNDAYRAAILRRVLQQGPASSVLDIGTGTGLLSLFAVEAGAGQVYACDCSSTMIQIASSVLKANGVSDKVNLINKLSSDITIPTVMPARVSLVVTETVDAGLLGEGILQSLIHAWDNLLLPQASETQVTSIGKVVPEAAGVWIVPIECIHIARKYRHLKSDLMKDDKASQFQMQEKSSSTEFSENGVCSGTKEWDIGKISLKVKRDEPYDTENLDRVPGGYRFLAPPCSALQIKFSDRQDMADWLYGPQSVEHSVVCSQTGRVDAVAAWFDLHLDDVTTLSSAPDDIDDRDGVHKANCWDQAVFPLCSPLHVELGQKLHVTVTCHGGKLSVNICGQSKTEDTHMISKLQDAFSCSKISVVQNDSFSLKELKKDGQKVVEKYSMCANSCTEMSRHILNTRKLPNCSKDAMLCKSNKFEKETEFKSVLEEHTVAVREAKLNVLCSDAPESGSYSETMLHDTPKSVISCDASRCFGYDGAISKEAVQFLNDEQWMGILNETVTLLLQEEQTSQPVHISAVLDLSPFPVFGLQLLMRCPARLMCLVRSAEEEAVIRRLAELNGISTTQLKCVREEQLLEELGSARTKFDVIMAHFVNPSGELKETAFNMIPILRSSLAKNGIFLPHNITVMGQLLQSDWLDQVSHVQNSRTCGYDIAQFINTYQVSQHLDLNLSTLDASFLSNPVELLELSLDRTSYQITRAVSAVTKSPGVINALAYWYNIKLHQASPPVCTFNPSSHVNQVAILLQPCVHVDEEILRLLVRFHQGLIHVEPALEDRGSN